MATRKTTNTKTGKRNAQPKGQPTGNWFTDAMTEANMGVVRAHERKARKK